MKTIRYAVSGALIAIGMAAMQCAPVAFDAPEKAEHGEAVATSAAADSKPGPGCNKLCDPQHRECRHTDDSVTVCGACLAGYVANAAGVCAPKQACASQPCGAHQTCDDSGASAVCLSACDAGYLWDAALGACRLPKACADLPCGQGLVCAPGPSGSDATCQCATGSGFDPGTSACLACASVPTCTGATESGRVLSGGASSSGACGCELRDGYFIPADGSATAIPCDADGDGWVNASAQPVVEWDPSGAVPEIFHTMQRCHVRHATKIVLQGEDGRTAEQSVTANTPNGAGLPLYEDSSLDGADASATSYDALDHGRAVNGFTKACATPAADFNANDIADVDEAPKTSLDQLPDALLSRLGSNTTLAGYYLTYTQYSYFLEVTNGWYEEPTPGAGVYRIAERHRIDDAASVGVGLKDSADPTSGYWQVCPRKSDVLSNATLPGYDFTSAASTSGYPLMGHSSQFKCVHVLDGTSYANKGSTEATRPQDVAMTTQSSGGTYAWTLSRTNATNHPVTYASWAIKTCTPATTIARPPPGIAAANPSFPAVSCVDGFGTSASMPPPTDVVRWVVVDGIEGATYDRGCVDLCRDPKKGGCTPDVSICSHPVGFPVCGCPDPQTYDGDGKTIGCSCIAGRTPSTDANNNPVCADINECAQSPCSPYATCTNYAPTKADPRTYACGACPSGYEGDGVTCTSIDPCAKHTAGAQCDRLSQCVHTGPATSSCSGCGYGYDSVDGWEGSCDWSTYHCSCPANSTCNGLARSGWECDCNPGYVRSGSSCVPPDPCTGVRCGAHAVCSGGVCGCLAGYSQDPDTGTCVKHQACPCGGIYPNCKIVCPRGR